VILTYLSLCRLLRRHGHQRAEAQTPLEYLTGIQQATAGGQGRGSGARREEAAPDVYAPAAALTRVFLDARYGQGPVTEEAAQAARLSLAAVRGALRSAAKGNGRTPAGAGSRQ